MVYLDIIQSTLANAKYTVIASRLVNILANLSAVTVTRLNSNILAWCKDKGISQSKYEVKMGIRSFLNTFSAVLCLYSILMPMIKQRGNADMNSLFILGLAIFLQCV